MNILQHVSAENLERRSNNLPKPKYSDELPICKQRHKILDAIQSNPVIIVSGETGSGKTTQLPKFCLELGRGVSGLIGHTQPRRIAARSVAIQIAKELSSPFGHAVGYKVRFSDNINQDTYIKLMTDGILLAETQSDPYLQKYDTIIIDEAHERSLNIDFLLGYLKQLLPKRADLKLIITSATIDAERFSHHFNHAPVIEVSGRTYPVEMRYHAQDSDQYKEEYDLQQAILDAIDELLRIGMGDILIFLPGEREIKETAETLRKHSFNHFSNPGKLEILCLYARLSYAEQQRIFHKSDAISRIILTTNVAETSLTVPGIRYVIDPGVARINRYNHRNKIEQLFVEKISQASANQRAGRCGRVMSGICIRLYAKEDFETRPPYTDPEILRTSLASVILRMKSLKIGDIENFPFIQPPLPRMIADGYQSLNELGAIDRHQKLTSIGWQLAKFPIDPKIARMILAAKQENCLSEILIIASVLSLADPRERPFDQQEAADRAHLPFHDERSDFIGLLKLWSFFDELLKHKKSKKKLITQCQEHFISYRKMREWREIYGQLHTLVLEFGLKPNQVAANYDEIHRALLAGLLSNVGFKSENEGEYLGARGIKFFIYPGSTLKKAKPKWIVAAELVETTKLYARCVATIDVTWLEKIAGKLCKRHFFDPHWEKKTAQVMVYERVTLYGLTIVPKRSVIYGKINSKEAREIFIRSAFVLGDYETNAQFFKHNRQLIQDIEELEHKTRRQDVLVEEQDIFSFYDKIIPESIFDGATFENWRKQIERDNPHLLYLRREYLMRHKSDTTFETLFPESISIFDQHLPLTYRFEPNHPMDGVTATIPLHLLNKLKNHQFQDLVPGLIREKITWCFKALPKSMRRNLIPIAEHVTQFLDYRETQNQSSSLLETLANYIFSITDTKVSLDTWDTKLIPLHLQMNYRIIDDAGKELGISRDLAQLQNQLGQAAQLVFSQNNVTNQLGIERDQITQWNFGLLPEEITFSQAQKELTGYPALVDQIDHVAIRLFDTIEVARNHMREGVRRLLILELKDPIKQLERKIPGTKSDSLILNNLIDSETLKQDMLAAIYDRALIGDEPLPHNEHEFSQLKQKGRIRLNSVADMLLQLIHDLALQYQILKQKLSTMSSHHVQMKQELSDQLHALIYPNFLKQTDWARLPHLIRYLKGILIRLDKYPTNPTRDRQHALTISTLWNQYHQRYEKHSKRGIKDPKLEEFRWQIEELRISLFAQELKTPYPVSVKRLQKLWEQVHE